MIFTDDEITKSNRLMNRIWVNTEFKTKYNVMKVSSEDGSWETLGYIKIKFKNPNIYLKIRVFRCTQYMGHFIDEWRLYVNNLEINKNEDGIWWDILRGEFTDLTKLLQEFETNTEIDKLQEKEDMRVARINALKEAEELLSGKIKNRKPWWKLW
jgi:hypothetical protein